MSILEKIKKNIWYGLQKTPFYSFFLIRRTPTNLAYVVTDLWPGEARKGRRLLEGSMKIRNEIILLTDLWYPQNLNSDEMQDLHTFSWLRDLRAVGDNASRRLARQLILSWIEHHSDWRSPAWEPGVLGHRLSNWIALYEFFCASADETFRGIFFKSLSRQALHLSRSWSEDKTSLGRLYALKGFIFCLICLWENHSSLSDLISKLETELSKQLLSDGAHVSGDPSIQLTVLQDLIDIRTLLRSVGITLPSFIPTSIYRMAPIVRLFRHGDGCLASFGGSTVHASGLVDVVLSLADAKGRPPTRLVDVGFERCSSKGGLLLLKVGEPKFSCDSDESTGLFKFEWSSGRERLILNADIILENPQQLGVLNPTQKINRHTQKGHTLLDMSAQSSGFSLQRQIYLSETQADLRGQDDIILPVDMGFAIRFILSDQIDTVSVTPSAHGVQFTSKAGHLWHLLISGAEPIICDEAQLSICLFGHVSASQLQTIKWAFRKD